MAENVHPVVIIDEAGNKTELSHEEWQRRNEAQWRRHWETCTVCIRATERTEIKVTDIQRKAARNGPVCVGTYTFPKWTGHSRFYLARCPNKQCESGYFLDYPHGYTSDGLRSGLLYIRCDTCEERLPLYDREVCEAQGMPAPPSFWGVIKHLWNLRKTLKEVRPNSDASVR